MFDWLEKTFNQLFVKSYNYEEMSKDELEEIGRKKGIELDKRLKKETLIKQLKELDK